jgi:hypothetical protein
MKHDKLLLSTGLLIAIAVLGLGCGPSREVPGGQPETPMSIDCHVFYRNSPGESLRESNVMLNESQTQEVVQLDDLVFSAQFLIDQGEGRSLSISVTDPSTGDEIVRQLYQIDPEKGLSNQFIGGHGFTGLVYVYRPDTPAEMQYFCEAL